MYVRGPTSNIPIFAFVNSEEYSQDIMKGDNFEKKFGIAPDNAKSALLFSIAGLFLFAAAFEFAQEITAASPERKPFMIAGGTITGVLGIVCAGLVAKQLH